MFSSPNPLSRSLFALLIVVAAASPPLRADLFVDIPDVAGAATDSNHRNWIVCQSAAFGVASKATSATRGASAPGFSEITLVRDTDVSSPDLFFHSASGIGSGSAILDFARVVGGERVVYLRIELTNARVTGYSVTASEDSSSERVTLGFSAIKMTYFILDGAGRPTGRIEHSWDLIMNRGA